MKHMLGIRIAALRRRNGFSQTELARRLHISPSAVGNYEQGRREPSADILIAIAKEFSVSIDFLLSGKPITAADYKAFLFVADYVRYGNLPGEEKYTSLSNSEKACIIAAVILNRR